MLEWFAELDRRLQGNHADVPEVEAFHEQYIVTRKSVERR